MVLFGLNCFRSPGRGQTVVRVAWVDFFISQRFLFFIVVLFGLKFVLTTSTCYCLLSSKTVAPYVHDFINHILFCSLFGDVHHQRFGEIHDDRVDLLQSHTTAHQQLRCG